MIVFQIEFCAPMGCASFVLVDLAACADIVLHEKWLWILLYWVNCGIWLLSILQQVKVLPMQAARAVHVALHEVGNVDIIYGVPHDPEWDQETDAGPHVRDPVCWPV
jgi:hypothetical protein